VDQSSDQAHAQAELLWQETLRRQPPEALTPETSVTAGRVGTDPELARRAGALARARAAHAGAADAEGADYLLGKLLGAGGMGLVYSATQVALDRAVAVKVLRPQWQTDEPTRQEFLAEALVAADLDHPNTVPVYDVGLTSSGALFYSMKLVRGTKWSSTLPANALEDNLDILLKVCDVVGFAHEKGVIHRDLKPQNVMVGAYGEVLLMDWGLAASVGGARARGLDKDNVLAGTPAYMAPEVAACAVGKIGKASDIYLLGGILYEIVTGLRPHGGAGVMACLAAAIRNELQPTEKTGALLPVALRALRTEPADRYVSVNEFAGAVRDFMAHQISLNFSAQARERFEGLPGLAPEDFYRECEEIIGLFQRALASWPGNSVAAERLVWLRETLSAVALRRGDIQLARSSARAAEQERHLYDIDVLRPDAVAERIKACLTDRDRGSWQQQPDV
jgi:serine/threonine protein kinase